MNTPWISFQATPQRLEYYNRDGQKRALEVQNDGQLESALQDGLRPGFVSDLDDPRLQSRQMGPGWSYFYQDGEKLRLGAPDGPHQVVSFADGVQVTTMNAGVNHEMAAPAPGRENARERAQLDVSPAGVDVLCDGKVLFQMPSAFTGGCTI